MAETRQATELVGYAEVGQWFGVAADTVSQWRTKRYRDTHPTPEPDSPKEAVTPLWRADRREEWEKWEAGRPGRGRGGGRKPQSVNAPARRLRQVGGARQRLVNAVRQAAADGVPVVDIARLADVPDAVVKEWLAEPAGGSSTEP